MILGFSWLTWIHTVISLVPLITGVIVLRALLRGREASAGLMLVFLLTVAATSLTGFLFPLTSFLPSHSVAIVALLVLGATLLARYRFGAVGSWRWVYVGGLVISFYLDAFVLMAQFFAKVPALKRLAPNGTEPPFAIAQLLLLLIFVWLGALALRRFRVSIA